LARALEECLAHRYELPEGCSVTYELEAIDILKDLLRSTEQGDQLEAFYKDFRERNDVRPTASEVFHAGFKPRATGHGGWFDFVEHMGDLANDDLASSRQYRDLLIEVGRTQMTKSYKMLVLKAMLQGGAFPGSLHIDKLVERFAGIVSRNPRYRADCGEAVESRLKLRRLVEQNPIKAWVEGRGTSGSRYFAFAEDRFSTTFNGQPESSGPLSAMVDELVEWRLAEYLGRSEDFEYDDTEEAVALKVAEVDQAQFTHDPELWREYMREEIPPLFGLQFNPGAWHAGFVVQGNNVFLLVTLNKRDMSTEHQYGDRFLSSLRLQWHSQKKTKRASKNGRIISEPGHRIHLFVRASKKRPRGTGAPFIYCGLVTFESWTGDRPIEVEWRMAQPVPEHLHRIFMIPPGW
jgi:hypothetical protein